MSEVKRVLTPIQRFQHSSNPEKGDVTLFGVIHIGQPEYYRNLQRKIAAVSIPGGVIHYEGIRNPSDKELSSATRSQRFKLACTSMASSWYKDPSLIASLGLVYQWDVLQHDEAWENHDVTKLELAKRLRLHEAIGEATRATLGKLVLKSLAYYGDPDAVARALSTTGYDEQMGNTNTTQKSGSAASRSGAMLSFRNSVELHAVDDFQQAQPGRDLGLLWGVDHLLGLGQGLSERGYSMTHQEQLVAIDPSSLQPI